MDWISVYWEDIIMKMTSACANKMLKKLNEDKDFWRNKEQGECFYTAAENEEPVIPDYDYVTVSKEIAEIDEKMCVIKHAINLANVSSQIQVGDKMMSVDQILVKMAQLNNRKRMLDIMRKRTPKKRLATSLFGHKTPAPEYEFINYDLELVKADYERIDSEIMEMQIALDKYNQTFEFEVAI